MKTVLAISAVLLLVACTSAAEEKKEEKKPDIFFYNTKSGQVSWTDPRPAKHIDDEGRIFYTDPLKPETTPWWEGDTENTPVAWAWEMSNVPAGEEGAGKPYFYNRVDGARLWEVPEAMAWKKMHSDKTFYYNTVTGESSRERPEQMGFHDESSGRAYWLDKTTGTATWESEHWWTEVTMGDENPEYAGRKYWVQELTQEVALEKPAALAWVEWHEEVQNPEL